MNVHSFTVRSADGREIELSAYAGQVLLIVNVASKCGLTPQYAGLDALQQEYGPSGLQVLGFPCNQFGGQEPGTDAEIQEFCSVTYPVSFPVLAKIEVNGADADPLYRYLRSAQPGHFDDGSDAIQWNFTKFLVSREGDVIKRYEPKALPATIGGDLPAALA